MSIKDLQAEYIRLRQSGMSARDAYAQVFPNGHEQEIAKEQADAQSEAGLGQVAGIVGGAGAAKLVGDAIAGTGWFAPSASTALEGGSVALGGSGTGVGSASALAEGVSAAQAGGDTAAALSSESVASLLPEVSATAVGLPLAFLAMATGPQWGPGATESLGALSGLATGFEKSLPKSVEAMRSSPVLQAMIPGFSEMNGEEKDSVIRAAQDQGVLTFAGAKPGQENSPDEVAKTAARLGFGGGSAYKEAQIRYLQSQNPMLSRDQIEDGMRMQRFVDPLANASLDDLISSGAWGTKTQDLMNFRDSLNQGENYDSMVMQALNPQENLSSPMPGGSFGGARPTVNFSPMDPMNIDPGMHMTPEQWQQSQQALPQYAQPKDPFSASSIADGLASRPAISTSYPSPVIQAMLGQLDRPTKEQYESFGLR